MKTLEIPFVDIEAISDRNTIVDKLSGVSENEIACVNWPDSYPSKPKVSFKIAHNNESLFLHYFVEENEILAETREDNGPVWTDSCVEFFISFDDAFYYNAEFSCIGKALLGYRASKANAEHAGKDVMDSIKRYPSLGTEPFGKKKGQFEWDLLLVVPLSAYWSSNLKSFHGIEAKGNFYKCGDNLSECHYLSWNPIGTEKPDFHRPEYFGKLLFL
ncbi:carbohydrate-binding family 9-like protein [Dysgonomonas sp. Marseille-P4361]|uniref:carbohydrate-binding family 9-like protein n=1 Tax=Dysgonomonas sp. Marseille-P4361 TaxID=2161820 RepID=UPI000D55794C|nr:carbohydrate-binding family 9-like protein [Dysgonomonas sp. Marseille-P4361]